MSGDQDQYHHHRAMACMLAPNFTYFTDETGRVTEIVPDADFFGPGFLL